MSAAVTRVTKPGLTSKRFQLNLHARVANVNSAPCHIEYCIDGFGEERMPIVLENIKGNFEFAVFFLWTKTTSEPVSALLIAKSPSFSTSLLYVHRRPRRGGEAATPRATASGVTATWGTSQTWCSRAALRRPRPPPPPYRSWATSLRLETSPFIIIFQSTKNLDFFIDIF